MKGFTFILLVHSVFLLHDVHGTCISCEWESISNNSNLPPNVPDRMSLKPAKLAVSVKNAFTFQLGLMQSSSGHARNRSATTAAPANTAAAAAGTVHHTAAASTTESTGSTTAATGATAANMSAAVHYTADTDDVTQLFMAGDRLAVLPLEEKASAVLRLTSHYGAAASPPPPLIARNLVRMFAYTRGLFAAVCAPALRDVLALVTVDPCAGLSDVSAPVRGLFAEGALSAPAAALYRAPRPALAALLRAAAESSRGRPPALSRAAAEGLVTALALSAPLFHALPPDALGWTLRAAAGHADLLPLLPPSTVAALLDRLLRAYDDADADDDAADGPYNAAPLAAVLAQAMTVRTLSVLPAAHADLLLDAVARRPALREALPPAALAALFDALAAAPVLLNRVDPHRLAHALLAVAASPGRPHGCGVPEAVVVRLLGSMRTYSSRGLQCLPGDWLAHWSAGR